MMRVLWLAIGVLAGSQAACCLQPQPPVLASQLVREVVFNELSDHRAHGYWRYWIERRTSRETRLEDQVETAEGPINRISLSNGRPLSPEAEVAERERLQRLLASPAEQARRRQEYEDDENRIGRILALLPDAFVYDYDGGDKDCQRLRFRPNPAYPAHSIEARIFHAMSGTLWVNTRYKRLARLDGRVDENVDFGYGILGRLYKGGWFSLQRTQVSSADWKTERLEVHMMARALLVKTFARETSEARGGFLPVPAGMNLAQGRLLLEEDQTQARNQAPASAPDRTSLIAPAALALRR
ncbi:MAG: hypothetical protein ABR924_01135 [Terracidiphilus sp.]|jgi:hypothetical protein